MRGKDTLAAKLTHPFSTPQVVTNYATRNKTVLAIKNFRDEKKNRFNCSGAAAFRSSLNRLPGHFAPSAFALQFAHTKREPLWVFPPLMGR